MSVEQMLASIEELLGMQGLGSGSWNKEGGVPAAVEREQRTLVREIKVCTAVQAFSEGRFEREMRERERERSRCIVQQAC